MAVNVYLMPATGSGTRADPNRGKYWDSITALGLAAAEMDYGLQPVFLVAAQDVPSSLHQTIAADPACTAVPDLGQNVGAQLTSVQNSLESLNIPSQWVGAGMSYGSVVRVVAVVFQLMQRLAGNGVARLLDGTVTLDTRFNQLPQGTRNALLDMARSFNFNTSSLSGSSTLRQIFRELADQWPQISIPVGPVTL